MLFVKLKRVFSMPICAPSNGHFPPKSGVEEDPIHSLADLWPFYLEHSINERTTVHTMESTSLDDIHRLYMLGCAPVFRCEMSWLNEKDNLN